ncbi:hypothetical protein F5Y19DRAFT_484674 [Xylariaceae sp. FL1651]|nr:hypothetical protein F5Y19DRAFT_484674 [Xylariaceae sp. FL1651]
MSQMQLTTSPKRSRVLPRKRSDSFTQLLKKTYLFGKKDRPTTSPPASREADLKAHTLALGTALTNAWPRRHHSQYRAARALLICWGDNDPIDASASRCPTSPSRSLFQHPLSPSSPTPTESSDPSAAPERPPSARSNNRTGTVKEDMSRGPFVPAAYQLADVLERRYGIAAQVWMVPTLESPHSAVAAKVTQFVRDFGGPDNLLVFWYGGRAEFISAAQGDGDLGGSAGGSDRAELVWYGLRDEPGIPARTVSKVLGTARADVLMLADCPFAQHACHTSGPSVFELLGAGILNPDPASNPTREASFTRTLALMLDSPFLASRGVAVLDLHRKLVDVACPRRPDFDATTAVTTTTTSDTEDTSHPRPASLIVGRAQRSTVVEAPPYPVYCQLSAASQLNREARRSIVLSRLNAPLGADGGLRQAVGEPPGVMLDIKLRRPGIDVQKWKAWLLRAPGEVEDVSVKLL